MSLLSQNVPSASAEVLTDSPFVGVVISTCRQHWGFIALAILQAFLLNLAYIGPGFNDDPDYIDNAIHIMAEKTPALSPEGVRLLTVGPLAISFGIFGIGDLAIRVLSTFWGIAGLTAVYALGCRIQGRLLAVVSSLFW